MNALRALGLLSLPCLLAGCWQSEGVLIDGRHAARPPIEGVYRSADPTEQGDGPMRFSARADGGFIFGPATGKDQISVFLTPLRGDWFVMQYVLEKTKGRPDGALYSVVHVGADRLALYEPPCDATLDDIAGMKREMSTCTFTTLNALQQAGQRALRRIEAGEPESEPAVLIRD